MRWTFSTVLRAPVALARVDGITIPEHRSGGSWANVAFLAALLGALIFSGCDRISILSPTASSDQNQEQSGRDCSCGDCSCSDCTGSDCNGSGSAPTTFACPLDAGGSSCAAIWDGGGTFPIRVTCAATAATPAVDRTEGPHGSGVTIDPIQGAAGAHTCNFELVGPGLTATQTFQS